jgi:hypothetical protein
MPEGKDDHPLHDAQSGNRLHSAEIAIQADSVQGGVHVIHVGAPAAEQSRNDLVVAAQRQALDAFEQMGLAQRQLIESERAKHRLGQLVWMLSILHRQLQETIERLTKERKRLLRSAELQSAEISRLQQELAETARMRDRAREELRRVRRTRRKANRLARIAGRSFDSGPLSAPYPSADDPDLAQSWPDARLAEIDQGLSRISAVLDEQNEKLDSLLAAPRSHARPWYPRKRLPVAATALIVIGMIVWNRDEIPLPCGPPDSGITEMNGQCVGVTDGTFVFHPELAAIEQKIAAENSTVEQSGRGVTVAFLAPLTADGRSDLNYAEIRERLQGAYVAQHMMNRFASNGPQIRLVLANSGTHQEHGKAVVRQLAGLTRTDQPLVAVTGLGPSRQETAVIVTELARFGIPAISSLTTEHWPQHDSLTGYHEAAASYREQAIALREKISPLTGGETLKAFVEESNAYSTGTISMTRAELGTVFPSVDLTAFPATIDKSSLKRLFRSNMPDLCKKGRQWMLFAGRRDTLASFLHAVTSSSCGRHTFVMTMETDIGSGGSSAFGENTQMHENVLRIHNITVFRPAYIDPDWTYSTSKTTQYFKEFHHAYTGLGFHMTDTIGGLAAISYDGVLIAARGIHLASGRKYGNAKTSTAEVLAQIPNLNGGGRVRGATGEYSFKYGAGRIDRQYERKLPILTSGMPPQ